MMSTHQIKLPGSGGCQPLAGVGLMALVWGFFLALPALAQTTAADRAARERIAAERRQADAQLATRRWDCSHRFVVTACMNEARAEHRSTLERLGREEEALNSAVRHARAAQRLEIIREKTESLARAGAASATPTRSPSPLPVQRPAAAAASSNAGAPAVRGQGRAEADRAAARRAAATQARREEAEREQARHAQQRAERPTAAPLPPYPAIPPADAPSRPR